MNTLGCCYYTPCFLGLFDASLTSEVEGEEVRCEGLPSVKSSFVFSAFLNVRISFSTSSFRSFCLFFTFLLLLCLGLLVSSVSSCILAIKQMSSWKARQVAKKQGNMQRWSRVSSGCSFEMSSTRVCSSSIVELRTSFYASLQRSCTPNVRWYTSLASVASHEEREKVIYHSKHASTNPQCTH